MTALTDVVLAVLAAVWAARLFRIGRTRPAGSVLLWGAAFAALAAATLAAAAYHALEPGPGRGGPAALWSVVVVATGCAGAGLVGAAIVAASAGGVRRALLAAEGMRTAAFVAWGLADDDFLRVVANSAAALLIVLLIDGLRWFRHGAPSARWTVLGVGTSAAGAAVQQAGFGLAPWFDHNATYHVVQAAGLWCLYRGGALLADRVRAAA